MIIKSYDSKHVVSIESGTLRVSPEYGCKNEQGYYREIQIIGSDIYNKKMCLGKYLSEQKCLDIVKQICDSYNSGKKVFEMPYEDIGEKQTN